MNAADIGLGPVLALHVVSLWVVPTAHCCISYFARHALLPSTRSFQRSRGQEALCPAADTGRRDWSLLHIRYFFRIAHTALTGFTRDPFSLGFCLPLFPLIGASRGMYRMSPYVSDSGERETEGEMGH